MATNIQRIRKSEKMKMSYLKCVAYLALALCLSAVAPNVNGQVSSQQRRFQDELVVHEWGTFTELQDEEGKPLRGINTDDEPVPDFVHGFGRKVVEPFFYRFAYRAKALPYRHPQVTMRLETPVVYFYPPRGQDEPIKLDVEVRLNNGWLSEYYPDAEVEAPGIKKLKLEQGTVGSLRWEGLKVGTEDRFPNTDDPVWLNPRATRAAGVTAANGESERYLFYRGVGNFSGPVRVTLDRESGQIGIHSNSSRSGEQTIPAAWLVDVQNDGRVAFRSLARMELSKTDPVVTNYRFDKESFEYGNLELLKSKMHESLVENGLYSDEATAMLNTWNRAYFQSRGLRLFYVVPRKWTDTQMPLSISAEAQVERVMIGRIELITDWQRELITKLRSAQVTSAKWVSKIPESSAKDAFLGGRSDFGDLGVEIPEEVSAYLELGRFRNAMLREEQATRPTKSLDRFLKEYKLYPPVKK